MSWFVDILRAIWNFIKRIFLKICNFVKNIVSFFKSKKSILKNNPDIIATSIKENLADGNYHVVNCLYDTKTSQVVDYEEEAMGIETESLDNETQRAFAGKDMVIIQ